jgi:hypothetical protein
MSRPTSILLRFWVLAVFSLMLQDQALAQCDPPLLSVHVESMFARDTGAEIDQRLGPEAGRLRGLFDYSSYRLLRSEEADTPCGHEVGFFLPDGRVLQVRPLATHGNLVALELALLASGRAVMRTRLKVLKGGLLVLVGSQNAQEAYITSLTVNEPVSMPGIVHFGAATAIASPTPSRAKPISTK